MILNNSAARVSTSTLTGRLDRDWGWAGRLEYTLGWNGDPDSDCRRRVGFVVLANQGTARKQSAFRSRCGRYRPDRHIILDGISCFTSGSRTFFAVMFRSTTDSVQSEETFPRPDQTPASDGITAPSTGLVDSVWKVRIAVRAVPGWFTDHQGGHPGHGSAAVPTPSRTAVANSGATPTACPSPPQHEDHLDLQARGRMVGPHPEHPGSLASVWCGRCPPDFAVVRAVLATTASCSRPPRLPPSGLARLSWPTASRSRIRSQRSSEGDS